MDELRSSLEEPGLQRVWLGLGFLLLPVMEEQDFFSVLVLFPHVAQSEPARSRGRLYCVTAFILAVGCLRRLVLFYSTIVIGYHPHRIFQLRYPVRYCIIHPHKRAPGGHQVTS
jgi:hypothetical protein